MKNFKGNSTAIVVGAAVGAVLMALVIAVVFGLKTGMAGAILAVLLIGVAALSGWMVGMQYRIREINYASYQRGYHEGLAKKTLIVEQPNCRCAFMVPDDDNIL